jgi:mRNA interferase RelE/StbE
MKVAFRKSFTRDLEKVKDQAVLERVRQSILLAESADGPQHVEGLRKLSGTETFFKIGVGDYRIGVVIEGDVIEFVRCLPRRDLYRFFP